MADWLTKPVWMWLQGTGYAYWMDREPTPRELSCMVYGSLIAAIPVALLAGLVHDLWAVTREGAGGDTLQ